MRRAVIDASGTYANPNPMGASGTKLAGEARHASRIAYGIPDVFGGDRATYRGQRVLVIGGGHSAANVLLDLGRFAEDDSQLSITWALRGSDPAKAYGGGANDQLAARGKLGIDLRRLASSGRLTIETSFSATELAERGDALVVRDGKREIGPFDRIVVCTGQRPDMSLTRELRLDVDPWLESARALGPMIDPNLHSCGTVRPHGYKELSHPEPDFFTAGIKSYGRAPTFLMATGYEQVRSIVAYLAGDLTASRRGSSGSAGNRRVFSSRRGRGGQRLRLLADTGSQGGGNLLPASVKEQGDCRRCGFRLRVCADAGSQGGSVVLRRACPQVMP